MIYATLDDVKQHLRYDDTSNDTVLTAYLEAATAAIDKYITAEVTSDMLPALKVATLLLCGHFDNDRNAEQDRPPLPTNSGLPFSVSLLLAPYRAPTVA